MHNFNWKRFSINTLTTEEYESLLSKTSILPLSERLLSIRNFFLQETVFNKVILHVDPMWIANAIHIDTVNGH
jgi:hypothetical protein